MAKPEGPYVEAIVEARQPGNASRLRGGINVRPVDGQDFPTWLQVESFKSMSRVYFVGTPIRIWAKLTEREGGADFLSNYHGWPMKVLPNG